MIYFSGRIAVCNITGTAQVNTIRLKLFKIGGVVIRNTRRERIMLSSAYPHQALFVSIANALDTT